MKYLIFLSLMAVSCTSKKIEEKPFVIKETAIELHQCPKPIIIRDTVLLTKEFDSLQIVIVKKNDSLFKERYRLDRVKYYNRIAQNNPSQMKFLVGWINRAVK